jgi:hypothetical protein
MEPALVHATEPELLLQGKQCSGIFLQPTSVNVASGRPNINLASCHRDMNLFLTVTVAYLPRTEFYYRDPLNFTSRSTAHWQFSAPV